MNRRLTTTLGGLAAVAALAVPLATVASAEDSPPGTSATTTTVVQQPASQRGGLRHLRRLALARKVADHLGITVDELRAAVREARTHRPAEPITDRAERRAYWLHQGALALHVSDDQLRTAIRDARAELRAERGGGGGS